MDKLLVIMGLDGEHDNTALAIDNAITLGKSIFFCSVRADGIGEVVAKKEDAESAPSFSASYLPIITPIMVQYFSGLDELGKAFSIMLGCKHISAIQYSPNRLASIGSDIARVIRALFAHGHPSITCLGFGTSDRK